jgi:hypothetical protein
MRPLITILLLSIAAHAGTCTPFESASEKVGEVACIKGRVRKVSSSPSGTWFLNYCEDHNNCQFSVVVFARDLRDVGDIRALEGKDLEISGKVKSYKGQPEIILKDRSQPRASMQTSRNCRRTSMSRATGATAREHSSLRRVRREVTRRRSRLTARTQTANRLRNSRTTQLPSSGLSANTSFPAK